MREYVITFDQRVPFARVAQGRSSTDFTLITFSWTSPLLVPGIDVYSTYFVIEESPWEDSTRGRASTVPGEASLSFGLKPAMHNDPVH